jgi:hypothetical protein
MARPGQSAAKQEQAARELRKQAEDLYKSASPAQQEAMRRWIEQAGQTGGPGGPDGVGGGPGDQPGRRVAGRPGAPADPPRFKPVDARDPNPAPSTPDSREQVVAEWLGDGDQRRDPAATAAAESHLREAARGAEQAIGDRVVPSRYDRVLREYFRRLPERVLDRPANAPAPAAPAKDAP